MRQFYFFLISRCTGQADKVNSTTSSPVIVLMSWWRLNTLTPVIPWIMASMVGRAISIRCVRTCLSRSRPFSAGSDLTRCCSAAVKTPLRRTTIKSSKRYARTSLGPRPMYSCSKRLMPSEMALSISPCVFMGRSYRIFAMFFTYGRSGRSIVLPGDALNRRGFQRNLSSRMTK